MTRNKSARPNRVSVPRLRRRFHTLSRDYSRDIARARPHVGIRRETTRTFCKAARLARFVCPRRPAGRLRVRAFAEWNAFTRSSPLGSRPFNFIITKLLMEQSRRRRSSRRHRSRLGILLLCVAIGSSGEVCCLLSAPIDRATLR